ncbi:hypothetical protein [Thalassotalea euphylliae]|uniref:Uncharacterized protein n=1 Tax=Thalassotalea euphylliae TaxID=1655234 RepID=A0A3E0UIL3_9GAMM|nr:hypothetical protein [Thalassotalea euphylliae]REL36838.1 hypothetical protein DXX92_16780 [Thalassotalea euphylliae]
MTRFNDQLEWRIESAEHMLENSKAPLLAEDIWRIHQLKQLSQTVGLAVLAAFIALSLWWYHWGQTPMAMPDYITQSHQYEQQLAQYADVELSERHSAIMANWHHELSVIDQTLERGKGNLYNVELWQRRTSLLKLMVEFYTRPLDLYEI